MARKPFDGVVVFLTSMRYENVNIGGIAVLFPTQDNACSVSRRGLRLTPAEEQVGIYSTVAHEIAHKLALDHIFENFFNSITNTRPRTIPEDYEKNKRRLPENEQELLVQIAKVKEIFAQRESLIAQRAGLSKWSNADDAAKLEENINIWTASIIDWSKAVIGQKNLISSRKRRIESYEWFRDDLRYKNFFHTFQEDVTDNIMGGRDTSMTAILNLSFFKWQWDIMRKDLKKFHSKKQGG